MRGVDQEDVEESGNKIGTRCTQVYVPSVEDLYVLLEIHYMIIDVFTRESLEASPI
jgi:hypothetical protein